MKKITSQWWVYSILILSTIFMMVWICFSFKHQKNTIPGYLYNQFFKDALQDKINKAPYHPIHPFSITDLSNTSLISEIQKSNLVSSLNKMLNAYSVGNVETYLDFLEPKSLNWKYNQSVIDSVKESGKVSENATGEDVVKYLLGEYSNHTGYKSYFDGIVVDPSDIELAVGSTNEFHNVNHEGIKIIETNGIIPFGSSDILKNYITLGVAARLNLIQVSPSPTDVLKKYGGIVYVNIYWLIKPNEDVEIKRACFPLVAQFYLDPENDRWITSAVARGNVWKDLQYKERILF